MRVPADERKEQLISATVELMRREGVQSVTIRAIAKEANANLAAAHYCFSNKDELMDAAAEAWFKNLSRFSKDASTELGLRKAVEQVAEGYWRALQEEPSNLLAEFELIFWATRNAAVSRPKASMTLERSAWLRPAGCSISSGNCQMRCCCRDDATRAM